MNADMSKRGKGVRLSWPEGIVAVFVVSRGLAFAAGIQMDMSLQARSWQLLDPVLLQYDLGRSLLYLHSQPPLFNVIFAGLLQLEPQWRGPVATAVWNVAGLSTFILLYLTATTIGVRSWLAGCCTLLFMVSPAAILYEKWFYPSEIEVFLLALTFFSLASFAKRPRVSNGIVFTSSCALLVLLRATYHPLVFAVIILMTWRLLRVSWTLVLTIAVLPLLLVTAWSVKNYVLFGATANSTWLGMNMARALSAGLSTPQLDDLQKRGVITERPVPFGPPTAYPYYQPRVYGVAAVDRLYKSDGTPNFNSALYIAVAKQQQKEVLSAWRATFPEAFLRAQLSAYTLWLSPSDSSGFVSANRARLGGYALRYQSLVMLTPQVSMTPHEEGGGLLTPDYRLLHPDSRALWWDMATHVSWTNVALHLLALTGVIWAISSGQRRGDRSLVTFAAVAGTLLFVKMIASNLFEFGENERFGYEVFPSLLLLALLGVESTARVFARKPFVHRSQFRSKSAPANDRG
jgi:hypothetical protein